MSKEIAQGPYVAAGVRFEPATLQTQGTELINVPQCPTQFFCAYVRIHTDPVQNGFHASNKISRFFINYLNNQGHQLLLD